MRAVVGLVFTLMVLVSCAKDQIPDQGCCDTVDGRMLSHEMIVLGDRLENPYKTENIRKALAAVYPTKADRVDVVTTDLYVRFLPADLDEYKLLEKAGLELVDHPLDYDILVEGDWYHDPEVPEEDMTWQYAVVPRDFEFPDVEYEIIDNCHIAENNALSKSDGIDWDEVEKVSYILTGNEDKLSESSTKATKSRPSGRISIVDEHANGGKQFGVAGVRVSCNSFVKFSHTYNDRDGYYQIPKNFSSKPRYRLIFKNVKGFSIGMNLVIIPASVSTLGKAGPEGVSVTVTKASEGKLFRRCVVNNAAYDYYSRCSTDDLNIPPPPSDLRIWLLNGMEASSAIMIHHGAILDNDLISAFLGKMALVLKYLLPDITMGTSNLNDYRSLYSDVCHELAHASHFAAVGKSYWNKYIRYIVQSHLESGGLYGDGTDENAGYCEVGETWAYYLESKMFKERYGGDYPTFGNSYWFHPQIFRFLDERGFECGEIFSVLDSRVTSKAALKSALLASFPSRSRIIEQTFNRY